MTDQSERLCSALTTVLNAIEANPRLSFAAERESLLLSMEDIKELSDNGELFLKDPVGKGLRWSVRRIGELLAKFHPEKMQDIAEKAASASGNFYVRIDIVDKKWDGLQMSNGNIWVA